MTMLNRTDLQTGLHQTGLHRRSRRSGFFWLMLAVIQGLPLVASAQLEEVVVSTRRREESLQDVPIAVSAITSEQIERQGISDLKDLVANQPSVQFDQSFGPADNRITIRGLSNTRGRSNVAFSGRWHRRDHGEFDFRRFRFAGQSTSSDGRGAHRNRQGTPERALRSGSFCRGI